MFLQRFLLAEVVFELINIYNCNHFRPNGFLVLSFLSHCLGRHTFSTWWTTVSDCSHNAFLGAIPSVFPCTWCVSWSSEFFSQSPTIFKQTVQCVAHVGAGVLVELGWP